MPPVNRNQPKRANSSESSYTVMDFRREFPDDAACLEWLWRRNLSADGRHAHCPKCNRERAFHRVRSRPSYSCDSCGRHLHPLAGTIFHKSSTSLELWFYAIFLMSQTRCGISAKQLERELGVTYKTAWRMFHQIRKLLAPDEDEPPLSGEVEADETLIGGKIRNAERRERDALGIHKKAWDNQRKGKVFAAVERGGRVRATVVPNGRRETLEAHVRAAIEPGSILYTDERRGYERLEGEYARRTIRHRDGLYAEGDVHTQTIEGFFGLLKNALRGVHHGVGKQHLQAYLDEYAFRYSNRNVGTPMFKLFLARVCRRLQLAAA